MKPAAGAPPLVVHVMHRFDTGGLENGVVNLINRMPRYRHLVMALTEVTEFRRRIQRDDVEFVSLRKPAGHGMWIWPQVARELRTRRPSIMHTRNLAALEMQVPARWVGVPVRIHGEHGRDAHDPDGTVRKYQWVRRAYRPFVDQYIALSHDLADYLRDRVGVPGRRVSEICNGVDAERFHPADDGAEPIEGCPFAGPGFFRVGTVGRMMTVKNQPALARAFVLALERAPALRATLRLVMVGDGPLRAEARGVLEAAGVADLAWLPGERGDVPNVMRGLDCFALPSLAEGISNTILEAMASGLPVVATTVGGNAELVSEGVTGHLVPAGDGPALAEALVRLASDPARARVLGRAGRATAEKRFSLQAMVAAYEGLYDRLLARHPRN